MQPEVACAFGTLNGPPHPRATVLATCRQGTAAEEYEVLNEVVVSRGANPFLTKIEVYEQGNLITKVSVGQGVGSAWTEL